MSFHGGYPHLHKVEIHSVNILVRNSGLVQMYETYKHYLDLMSSMNSASERIWKFYSSAAEV